MDQPDSPSSSPPPSPWTPPSLTEIAAEFPKLEIRSLLAIGGMSAVYLVRQEALDRLAVLKILPLDIGADAEATARFQTEARALASVRDRGVVEVYDFGRTPAGHLYLLLEYEGGGDLRHWLRQRAHPLTDLEALGIGSSIAGGLAAAHRKGIIHGDIKPDNIFIDDDGNLKVGDFGLAGATGTGTATHHTPGYTAPEILAGSRELTPATDLYAVGATLFELLLHQTPPEEPGSRAVQLQKLPLPVAEVIGWALQEDPAARPASAHDYRLALEKAAAEVATSAAPAANPGKPAPPVTPFRPPSPPRHLGKNQHQSPAAKNALVAVILALIGIVSYFKLSPPRPGETTSPSPSASAPEITSTTPAVPNSNPDPSDPAKPPAPGDPTAAFPSSSAASLPAPDPAPALTSNSGSSPATVPPTPATGTLTEPAMTAAADPIPFSQNEGVAVTPPPAAPTAPVDESEDWLDPNAKPATPPAAFEFSALPPATDAELAAWNPDWTLNAPRGIDEPAFARFSPNLEKDRKVLLLSPHSALRPAILSKRITLPVTGPQQLTARVAAPDFPKASWLLKAFADNQPLSEPQIISRSHFRSLTWDLTPWKGKTVTLRLENHPNPDSPAASAATESSPSRPSSLWADVKLEPLSPLLARATFDPSQASKTPPEPGFVDLFTAQQAAAWKPNANGGLSFTEGVATPFTKPGPATKGLIIFTKRAFRDFVLKVEFRMDSPEADSGVYLRLPAPSGTPSASTEKATPGDPVEIEIHGDTISSTGTGSIGGDKAPSTLPLVPGGWNKYELAVSGARHLLKLNGVLINEWIGKSAEPGCIALQFHQGDSLVHYRNCWIRETSSSLTLANPAAPTPKIGMAAAAGRPLGVPPDATPFNGKWFRWQEEKMLWRIAKKKCEDLRGHLAFIPDAATAEFLQTLSRNRAFWAGATDEKSEGRWLWLDGTPLDYNNWGSGQPDNTHGREDFLLVTPKGTWNDVPNDESDTRGFICEWD